MEKEEVLKSISLIGPSCVGKSLIASELSKKTDMPILCIDDLLVMIEYEKEGLLGPMKKDKQNFAKKIIDSLKLNPEFVAILKNKELKERQIKLINDIFQLYDSYIKMFGSLKPFYKILERYQERISYASFSEERIMNLNIVSVEIIMQVLRLVNQPMLFDLPASFGWSAKNSESIDNLNQGELKRLGNIDFSKTKIVMDSFLNTTNTVLLCPGYDYNKRNSVKTSEENQMLLKNLGNYFDNAKISISTNAVFNEPENKFLQKRSWLDPEESLEKDKLKNFAEINNICDQILIMIQELKQAKKI